MKKKIKFIENETLLTFKKEIPSQYFSHFSVGGLMSFINITIKLQISTGLDSCCLQNFF